MLSIAVCDDEEYMLDELEKNARGYFNAQNTKVKIVRFSGGEDLLKSKEPIDILFLDIQMEKMDGMETARRLRGADFKGYIIFVTILKELVFQAFEVQAFDYLLKPITQNSFDKVMDRLLSVMNDEKDKMLLIHIGNESRLISFNDIVYCEVIDRKIYLHLNSAETVAYYEKIEKLETKLDRRFFKCHRSYLINLRYLQSFKNGAAYMNTGETIPVSRLRNKEFADVVLRYMSERKG
ncbi:MAG: LytTR family DNA-binding domain-containing protein [Alistipes sp.]|nr:LytTR family DNA-binding domain-containing protein [Alistipes sp.]